MATTQAASLMILCQMAMVEVDVREVK